MRNNNKKNLCDYGTVGEALTFILRFEGQVSINQENNSRIGNRMLKGPRAGELGLPLVTLQAVKQLLFPGLSCCFFH